MTFRIGYSDIGYTIVIFHTDTMLARKAYNKDSKNISEKNLLQPKE